MTHDAILRLVVVVLTGVFAFFALLQIWKWHKAPNDFDLRDLFTAYGKDKKQHLSRAAVAEMVALGATTSGYLGALAVKPDTFTEATAVYGALWTARGAFSTYLRSKQK